MTNFFFFFLGVWRGTMILIRSGVVVPSVLVVIVNLVIGVSLSSIESILYRLWSHRLVYTFPVDRLYRGR